MTRSRLFMMLLAVLSASAGGLSYRFSHLEAPPPVVEPRLVDLDGRSHHLAEANGKVLVVNFWATWCQPCREEMKAFSAVQDRFAPKGVQFVGIAIDDPETVRSYLRDYPVSYPIWVGGDDVPAWADSLGNELSALPFTVVFDRKGQKREVQIGALKEERLLEILTPLIEGRE
jgi:thiol-disulfide isomerase/thioredoxin